MPQGKLKVKAKLPDTVKIKKVKNKGVTKRTNRPVAPKSKDAEAQKLKKVILKTINESMEKELRSKAYSGTQSLRPGNKSKDKAGVSRKK